MQTALPADYRAIPLCESEGGGMLRVCLLARTKPDAAGGRLVLLRPQADGRVFLGCVVDTRDRVWQWVEVWIQTVAGLAGSPASYRDALTNASLDTRWRRHAEALLALPDTPLLVTGSESEHPLPLVLHIGETVAAVHPGDPDSGLRWRLCTDDALLEASDLPPYSTTLHRYLYLPAAGDHEARFLGATPDAPGSAATIGLEEAGLAGETIEPVNLEAGLLLVRPYHPMALDDYLRVLGGARWEGDYHGRSILDPESAGAKAGAPLSPGRMFLGARGRTGSLLETLHLKLALLADALHDVHALVRDQKRPLLNLSHESFRVRFGPGGAGLPFLWTARAALLDPGAAVALPVQTTDTQYFARCGPALPSIYQPAQGAGGAGRGVARIRQVLEEGRRGTIIEGTFQTPDAVPAGTRDLVWLRLPLTGRAVDLFANFEQDRALAREEWRFRTAPQSFDAEALDALRNAQGVPLPNTPFDILPLLSSPCDLYSMAVLATRILLTNATTSLPVALDELISLAREASAAAAEDEDIETVLARLFESDPRWHDSLGPHRLSDEPINPEESMLCMPPSLWWSVLAAVIPMLPGIGRFSICRELGDAALGALHKVFEPVLERMRALLVRSRALIVTDWDANREVRRLVDERLQQVAVAAPEVAGSAPRA